MTCREVVDFLADYLDGSLPEADRLRFEQHLDRCPDCAAYLTTYAATPDVLRTAFASADALPPLPPQLAEAIVRTLIDGAPPAKPRL